MGKAAAPRALPENEAKAVARMLRVSPQKLNLVAQLIRGKKVSHALAAAPENLPTSHLVHVAALVPLKEPGAQIEQLDDPIAA